MKVQPQALAKQNMWQPFKTIKNPLSLFLTLTRTQARTLLVPSECILLSLSLAFSILRSTTVEIIAYSKRYFADTNFFLIQWKNNNVNTGGGLGNNLAGIETFSLCVIIFLSKVKFLQNIFQILAKNY